MKELEDKAIDIKGKEYVLVKDRVVYFNVHYPNGCIVTERISDENMEIFKATVYPDVDKPARFFTGYSQSKWWEWFINKTAAMENAETSAVGRALAFMWIGVIDSIASADEVRKAWADKEEPNEEHKEEKKDKPRFNKPELDNFSKKAGEYGGFEEWIKEIKKYYQISKAMEENVRKLYESLETIKK